MKVGENVAIPVQILLAYQGKCTNFYNALLQLLRIIIPGNPKLRFGISVRQKRQVALMTEDASVVPNIFQMSSGETSLINLFFSILRDFDSTGQAFEGFGSVRGIVVVDEIDLHLHTHHQRQILPELIKLFPKVQFILTTHSPLFVLGLDHVLGKNAFTLVQLPTGNQIDSEQFSEFESAYDTFRASQTHYNDLSEAIKRSRKPLLFVEGDYDVRYLENAGRLLGKNDILEQIEIKIGEGYGGLDKVRKHFDSKLADITPQKILIAYDCDIEKNLADKGNVFSRVIPLETDNPIPKGIENLFSTQTLRKAINEKPDFIDITQAHRKTVRGVGIDVKERWLINNNEKRNLCDWLCENGEAEDFQKFGKIFEMIEEILLR